MSRGKRTNSSFDIPPDFEGVCTRRQHDGTRLYNSYYQWIPIFLAIQAGILFLKQDSSIFRQ